MSLPFHAATPRPLSSDLAEGHRDEVLGLFRDVRRATLRLADPLSPEDQQLQSMPSASPTKWHLAHTSWFFEKAVLEPCGVPAFDPRYGQLFNSYYEAFGARHARPARGLLSRPRLQEVLAYRRHVEEQVERILPELEPAKLASLLPVVHLGMAHEEQHQELILTDILHAFSLNPVTPAYSSAPPGATVTAGTAETSALRFVEREGGIHEIGHPADAAFCFDNETPRHRVWQEPFGIASRPVVVRELKAFIRDGGYRAPSLWLSEGLDWVRASGISAPQYVREEGGELIAHSLHGPRVLTDGEPVSHVSYYEADALARYLGARLPTEAEWEIAAASAPIVGHFVESGLLHPAATPPGDGAWPPGDITQLFGGVWEWTASSYEPYPGFHPVAGALAEYNGKFMINQRVLRGGSCLTPARHLRATYRNFWHPDTRFQMTGLRLARSLPGE